MNWSVTSYIRAMGVRDNKAGVLRHGVSQARFFRVERDGEVKTITIGAVAHPFCVGAEIGKRGFDLDYAKGAIFRQCEEIGATSIRQGKFPEHRVAQSAQQDSGAARDLERSLRAFADGKSRRSYMHLVTCFSRGRSA